MFKGDKKLHIDIFGWHIYISRTLMRNRNRNNNGYKKDSWKRKVRDRLLDQNKGRCELCGNNLIQPNGTIHATIHHIKPVSLYPELKKDYSNLMLLCPKCHEGLHKEVERRGYVEILKSNLQDSKDVG